METVGQDIRFALRNLRKTPGFAIVAVITLALGIGASTAIFSVMENILMEPFPYPDATSCFSGFLTLGNFPAWRGASTALAVSAQRTGSGPGSLGWGLHDAGPNLWPPGRMKV